MRSAPRRERLLHAVVDGVRFQMMIITLGYVRNFPLMWSVCCDEVCKAMDEQNRRQTEANRGETCTALDHAEGEEVFGNLCAEIERICNATSWLPCLGQVPGKRDDHELTLSQPRMRHSIVIVPSDTPELQESGLQG